MNHPLPVAPSSGASEGLDFVRNPACTACGLSDPATRSDGKAPLTVCCPTARWVSPGRPLYDGRVPARYETAGPPSKPAAVVVVAEAPGRFEDREGLPFVGKSGVLLRNIYLEATGLAKEADIYFMNTVRCRPPGNRDPKKSESTACRPYMEADLQKLRGAYQRVVLLCVGTIASQNVAGLIQKKAFGAQGKPVTIGGDSYPVFHSYHPAYLLRGREPARVSAVKTHLDLLITYIRTGRFSESLPDLQLPPEAPDVPGDLTGPVSLDIETYGCLKKWAGRTHRPPVFQPAKMVAHDGVRRDNMVVTVGLAWRGAGRKFKTAIFRWDRAAHQRKLGQWLKAIRAKGLPILGFNLKFDMQVLRYVRPDWAYLYLNENQRLIDAGVYNFLHSDVRPERSLKQLAFLFGIFDYKETAANHYFEGPHDQKLWLYNIQDCVVSYLLWELLLEKIAVDYPKDKDKLSDYAAQWWSDQIWDAIEMEETGVAISPDHLHQLLVKMEEKASKIRELASEQGLLLRGKGSGSGPKSAQQVVDDAVGQLNDPGLDLVLTDETHLVSTKDVNLKKLKPLVGRELATKIKMIQSHRKKTKIIDSYLRPLLYGRGKKSQDKRPAHINGILYPSWYIYPSVLEGAEEEGGTIQCRMTCSQPGIQTFPPTVKAALCSRFRPGYLLWADLSQIELRVPAVLSGDRQLIADYNDASTDRHVETARLLFGDVVDRGDAKTRDGYRQGGKTQNFLMQFRGGSWRLQKSVLEMVGIYLTLLDCEVSIDSFWQRHPGLREWQDGLIDFALREGYVPVPLVGVSRQVAGSLKTIVRTYESVICNLQVQAVAALTLESAHRHVRRTLRRRGLQSVSGIQVYDSLLVEGPPSEAEEVSQLVKETLANPPFYQDLCELYGRRVPLDSKIELKFFE